MLSRIQEKIVIVASVTGLSLVLVSQLPPLPQDLAYHDFADQRTWFGIPHTLDVLSSLAFLLVGGCGLPAWARGRLKLLPGQRTACLLFLLGVTLTAFGSGWYHLVPSNITLAWDRLPMAVSFMALTALVLGETVGERTGGLSLWPLVIAGVASVLWWVRTEQVGVGDLRWYAVVQFLPLLLLPFVLVLYRSRWTLAGHYGIAFAWYLLAKLFESLDRELLALTGLVSGHTLKHLVAALSAGWLVWMFSRRRRVS